MKHKNINPKTIYIHYTPVTSQMVWIAGTYDILLCLGDDGLCLAFRNPDHSPRAPYHSLHSLSTEYYFYFPW